MPLSIDALFEPLSNFFTKKFASDGTSTYFRFDHLPRTFSDADFIMPDHPELGASQPVAQELFSLVVDGLVHLDGDGRNLWLSTSRFSELYRDEILGPAIPFTPDAVTDAAEKQACIDSFNAVKADALRKAQVRLASVLAGAGVTFNPSIATPKNWFDKTDDSVWTSQSFHVQDAVSTTPADHRSYTSILRMKLTNTTLTRVLQSLTPMLHADSPQTTPTIASREAPSEVMRREAADSAPSLRIMTTRPFMQNRPIVSTSVNQALAPILAKRILDGPQAEDNGAMHRSVSVSLASLSYVDRLKVQTVIADAAQTQSVTADDATISFDYCIVNVDRSWYHTAFVNSTFWRIPGTARATLSANDGRGQPALPVGFVAIRRLKIQAPWTPEDINNLEQSVQFGPFSFDSTVVEGGIGHDGVQIIGWLLQDMPALPPADNVTFAPGPAS